MRSIFALVIAPIALAVMLSGCTATIDAMLEQVGAEPGTASNIADKTIGAAVTPIPVYCNAPAVSRDAFRMRVNAHPNMQGAKIGIACPGETLVLDATVPEVTEPPPEPAS